MGSKAQATLELLASFAIFLACATLLLHSLVQNMAAQQKLSHSAFLDSALSNSALNLGLIYIYGSPAPPELSRQAIPLRLQGGAVFSEKGFAYTLNPAQGATYAYSQKNIPD